MRILPRLLGLVLFTFSALVACSPQATQTPRSDAAAFTLTPVPSATPTMTATESPTAIPLSTNTPSPTRTPYPTPTPDPTPTPFVLTSEHPTDEDVARLALAPNLPPDLLKFYVARAGTQPFFERQDEDVNGDGQPEIIVTGEIPEWQSAYIAVLGREKGNPPDSAPKWKELFFHEEPGHYCFQMRATIKQDLIIADSLTCGGGSGLLGYHWKQVWIQCRNDTCVDVWSGRIFEAEEEWGSLSWWDYYIASIEQPDPRTILLTTRHFAIDNIACAACPLASARRVVGPDVQDFYEWNGTVWNAARHKQISQGIEITREYDKSAADTSGFIESTIHESFGQVCPDGYGRCYFPEKTRAALYEFFQVPIPQSPDDMVWKTWTTDAPAIQVAAKDSRGDKYAAILARTDLPSCRLAVKSFVGSHFEPIGFLDVPCVDTFTHLSWLDIDGDGKEELLLLTILRDETSRDVNQTLYVFRVNGELKELTRISGAINGADGVGIKWTMNQDGFRLLVGLPLARVEDPPWGFDNITLDRRFETYRWNAANNNFILADK